MERNRLVASATYQCQSIVYAVICRVALGACSQIDGSLGKRNASFGPSYLHYGVEGGIGQKQGVRVGKSYILGSRDNQSAGYELRVFSSFNHACHPVECGVGVGAAYRLDEGRDDVVMHLAVLIVGKWVLLQTALHNLVGNNHLIVAVGLDNKLQYIEKLARVASAIAQQGTRLLELYVALA